VNLEAAFDPNGVRGPHVIHLQDYRNTGAGATNERTAPSYSCPEVQ